MSGQTCFITLLTVELQIPCAQSLKDKRREIRGLKERIRSKFNASVAEVGYQDKWQRGIIAVCLVGEDKQQLMANTAKIRMLCQAIRNFEIIDINQEWL